MDHFLDHLDKQAGTRIAALERRLAFRLTIWFRVFLCLSYLIPTASRRPTLVGFFRVQYAMNMKKMWVFVLGLLVLSGCASLDPDAESDLPWNTPQPWEGTPFIPGFEGY